MDKCSPAHLVGQSASHSACVGYDWPQALAPIVRATATTKKEVSEVKKRILDSSAMEGWCLTEDGEKSRVNVSWRLITVEATVLYIGTVKMAPWSRQSHQSHHAQRTTSSQTLNTNSIPKR